MLETIKSFQVKMATPFGEIYNIPIKSITASDTLSIASILYASDLTADQINKYLQEIKDLNYENDGSFMEKI